MNNLLRIMMVSCLGLALMGCAGAVPWNKQNFAGIEEWSVDYSEGKIDQVHYVNGKELGGSEIKIQLADGTVLNFSGNDITAFGGQEQRAAVEKAIVEQLGDVGPGVVDAVLKALRGGSGE